MAVKKIGKNFTDDVSFQREMNALLHLRKNGGHPNIYSLRENFNEGNYYILVFDLVSGGEMFDHLIRQGAYSEADAARLVREVASALSFLHGIGCVHADLKPENLMLSTEMASSSAIKLVDFGCAQVTAKDSVFQGAKERGNRGQDGCVLSARSAGSETTSQFDLSTIHGHVGTWSHIVHYADGYSSV